MTRAIDIVVNLWTKEITSCYPPELDQFWDLVGILEMTKKGVTVEEELALMDEGGINKGLLVATTGAAVGFFLKNVFKNCRSLRGASR